MLQIYVMYIKSMLRHKKFYLWNLLFPMAISVLLFVVVGNLTTLEKFNPIKVGVVVESQEDTPLIEAMRKTKSTSGDCMFSVQKCSKQEAMQQLDDNELAAYVVEEEHIRLYINQNGLEQSMVKTFLDQYEQFQKIYDTAVSSGKDVISEKELMKLEEDATNAMSEANQLDLDNSILYFYTLLGMCCTLAIVFGFYLSETILSNQSKLAARMNCTPAGIFCRFVAGLLASLTVSLFSLILVMAFIQYVLGRDLSFENNEVWVMLGAGLLVGILSGYVIGSILPSRKAWKEPIAMVLILVYSFFGGIVRADVKYYMMQSMPWMRYLNPVNLVSDGLYALFYQDNIGQYVIHLLVLSGFAVILMIVSLIQTGRRAYDRI